MIVLEFDQEHADFLEAVRLKVAKQRSLFIFRLSSIIPLGLLGVALIALDLLGGHSVNPGAVLLLFYAVLLYYWPHIGARNARRVSEHQGRMRVTLDEEGVLLAGAQADARMRWGYFGSYAEGDRVFILRTPDRGGRGVTVIPKGGAADPADVDRLRDLLNRHLTRV
ncbi:YcxB family protein [Streptomyces sp. NPDC001401]|uniref:YcxB family protein n=1 Tax=Streptomyces sp. NPDC001401 TaxID=3364570 RepID=UPI0036B5FFB4